MFGIGTQIIATVVGGILLLVMKFFLRKPIVGLVESIAGTNKILKFIMHLLAPGLIALVFVLASALASGFCAGLGLFLLVAALVFGGLMGLIFIIFLPSVIPFLGKIVTPIMGPLQGLIILLVIITVLEWILPLVIPGFGLVIDIVLNIIKIAILAGVTGGAILGMWNCLIGSGTNMIPGTSIGIGANV